MSTHEGIPASSSEVLPWLSCVERQSELTDVTPGEYVLRTLFSEFTILTERKLEHVLAEPLVSCFDFLSDLNYHHDDMQQTLICPKSEFIRLQINKTILLQLQLTA